MPAAGPAGGSPPGRGDRRPRRTAHRSPSARPAAPPARGRSPRGAATARPAGRVCRDPLRGSPPSPRRCRRQPTAGRSGRVRRRAARRSRRARSARGRSRPTRRGRTPGRGGGTRRCSRSPARRYPSPPATLRGECTSSSSTPNGSPSSRRSAPPPWPNSLPARTRRTTQTNEHGVRTGSSEPSDSSQATSAAMSCRAGTTTCHRANVARTSCRTQRPVSSAASPVGWCINHHHILW